MENNRINEAVPLLQQAVASGSDDPIGHYALATALAQTGEEREAVDEYRKALALNPNPPAAWYDHLAVSLTQHRRSARRSRELAASLTSIPPTPAPKTIWARSCARRDKRDEGFQHLRKAIAMAPDYPDAHNHLGWELAKTGQLRRSHRPTAKGHRAPPQLGRVSRQSRICTGVARRLRRGRARFRESRGVE